MLAHLLLQGRRPWPHPCLTHLTPRLSCPFRSPDGYYCPKAATGPRANYSPVATPCPAGTRGTVFGQTAPSQCVTCNVKYYQDTEGEVVCLACDNAVARGEKTCLDSCPDGFFSTNPQTAACEACDIGTFRSGDSTVESPVAGTVFGAVTTVKCIPVSSAASCPV